MERHKPQSYQTDRPKSSHSDYIKICIDQAQTNSPTNEERPEIRFTFNKIAQDVINEEEEDDEEGEEEEFYKVDLHQIIELRKMVNSYKVENLRLVQQSNDNMHLFNNYMQEMQQRVMDKKGQIDSLKYRIKLLQERYFKCQQELKKAEIKLSHYNTAKRQQGVQCQARAIFRLNQKPEIPKVGSSRKDQQERCLPRDVKVRHLQKENNLISQYKQNNKSLAQSLQKQIKLKQVEQQYNNLRSIYFKSLNSTPRASFKHRNNSNVTDQPILQVDQNNSLNALVSPRIASHHPTYGQQQQHQRRQEYLLNPPSRIDKAVCKSTLMEQSSGLQFDKSDYKKYVRQQRRK